VSELFLEQSEQVLAEWDAARVACYLGQGYSDEMRWSGQPPLDPSCPGCGGDPCVPVSGVWLVSEDSEDGYRSVYLGEDWQFGPPAPRFLLPAIEINAQPFITAMRSAAEAMVPLVWSFERLARALGHSPWHDRHHPPPCPDMADYQRRCRARRRRRR
jgi:hypothetical protein